MRWRSRGEGQENALKKEKQEGNGDFCVLDVCTGKCEEKKARTRGGERMGNWEKEQMERQTESAEEYKVQQE